MITYLQRYSDVVAAFPGVQQAGIVKSRWRIAIDARRERQTDQALEQSSRRTLKSKRPGVDRALLNLVPKRGLEPPLGFPN